MAVGKYLGILNLRLRNGKSILFYVVKNVSIGCVAFICRRLKIGKLKKAF